MKIYIAGKITGDPYYKAKFARAAADIADAGHTPINPAMQPEGMSNADYMRISFAQLDSADAVAFLPDWEDSEGARIEHLLVEYTGKPTYLRARTAQPCTRRCGAASLSDTGRDRSVSQGRRLRLSHLRPAHL